jgi:hypothetical protein
MNSIVALSLGFKYDYLKPFLKSFNENVNGILFLVTDLDRASLPIDQKKIQVINYFKFAEKYNIRNLTPYNLKPIVFYLLLKEIKEQTSCKTALMTDVDVIFQKDPFTEYAKRFSAHSTVLAEERNYFKNCDTNTTWYKFGYNESYDEVKEKKILNCGVTIGDIDKLIDYQKQVATELSIILPQRNYFAYDQVILNLLTYVRKSIQLEILPHGDEFLIHLSAADEKNDLSEKWINNNLLAKPGQDPFIIVHQYDKKDLTKAFFTKKYE